MTLEVNDNVEVWVMKKGFNLDNRIAYDDIENYENMKGGSVIWGFDLDDKGKVEFIYEPLTP